MAFRVGVDVGGTKIAAGVVDRRGRIHSQIRTESSKEDPVELRADIVEVVKDLRRGFDVTAVGIGAAGFVTADRRKIPFAPHLNWGDEPVSELLEEALGIPVILDNDGNTAAWAEYRFGAGRGVEDQLLIALGTGIGGGLILGGQVYRGGHGMAGEVGHIPHVPGGVLCGCGRRGCLEQYASGDALVREAQAAASRGARALLKAAGGDPSAITGPMVTEAAQAGDPAAVALFDEVGTALGTGIAALVAVLDPSLVLIGGGVSAAGELLRRPAEVALRAEITGGLRRPSPPVALAALGNEAALIGAADQARAIMRWAARRGASRQSRSGPQGRFR